MEYNIYRLMGGLKPVSWQLPLKQTFVKKFVTENGKRKDLGFRRIKYVPGTDTIFAEDIKGDLKAQSIWFERGEMKVLKEDKLLNELLKQHPWLNKRYELWSQEEEDLRRLKEYRYKGIARQLIDDADLNKIKAISLAVFGYKAIGWTDEKCELELREYADVKPKKLQEVMKDKDYESKLFAGHAFVQGIVKENTGNTAVIWTDSDGVILKLAKGEKGITELGRYLAIRTDESELVVQSISDRLGKLDTNTPDKTAEEVLDEKDKEIAALRLKLSQIPSDIGADTGPDPLVQARKDFEERYTKEVPRNMKNNLAWITKQLSKA